MPALPQQISCFGEGQELDAGDGRQEIARRLADALRVRQMAGVVIGDAQRERMPPARCGPRPATISVTSRTRAEKTRARSPPRPDRRRAAGRTPSSTIRSRRRSRQSDPCSARSNTSIVAPRHRARLVEAPGVQRQGAAAALARRAP